MTSGYPDSTRVSDEALRLPSVNFEDIAKAKRTIDCSAYATPVLSSERVNELVGATVHFKCENLQRTGSFKFRGAYNAVSSLSDEERKRGVLAFSSGNHAVALAHAGSLLEVSTTVLMPADSQPEKINNTRSAGATVQLFDRFKDDRERLTSDLVNRHGLIQVHPFDNKSVIAGQGTAALELFNEVGELDLLLLPVGGGGLVSGSAIAARSLSPTCHVVGVEPEAGNDVQQSLKQGRIVKIGSPETIADGARAIAPGVLNFPIIQQFVSEILTATDAELIRALRFLLFELKLLVEPTGCLGFAPLLGSKLDIRGMKIGVVLSGGNVSASAVMTYLNSLLEIPS